ncbi:MAG: hypothetical protein ABII64_00560 [Elusimicrobiota bacterium]
MSIPDKTRTPDTGNQKLCDSIEFHIQRYVKDKKQEDKDKVIEESVEYFIPLMQKVASKNNMPIEELYSASVIGTTAALEKYNPNIARKHGAKFITYSKFHVYKNIQRELNLIKGDGFTYGDKHKYYNILAKHKVKSEVISLHPGIEDRHDLEDKKADEKREVELLLNKLSKWLGPKEMRYLEYVAQYGEDEAAQKMNMKISDIYNMRARIKKRMQGFNE